MTHITRFLILIAALLIAALVCSTAFAGRLPSAQEKQALRGPSGYRPGRSDPYATAAYVAAHAGGSAFTGDLAGHDLTDTGRAFVGVAKALHVSGDVVATGNVTTSASVKTDTIEPNSGSVVSLHNSSGNWRINAAGNLDNLAAGAGDILGGWVGIAIQSTILPALILSNPSSSGTNRISQQADNGVVHERAMCGTGLGGIIGSFLLERGFNTNGIKYALTQAGAYYQFETDGDVGSGTVMLKIQDRNDLLNARGYGWPSVPGTKIREPLTATSTNTSTAIELTSVDGNKPTITADGAHRYRAETVMYATAGANAGKSAAFTYEFLAKRVSGTVTIVAMTTPTTVGDESSGTWLCGPGTPSGDTVPVTFSADASSTVKATTVLTEIAAQ